jgi:hypothetical protein
MMKRSIVVLFCLLLSGCIGLAFQKTGFNDATTKGILTVGITKDEAREKLGPPDKVAARQTRYDVREVWTYYQTGERDSVHYNAESVLTLGVRSLFPPGATEAHYLVFSDNKLIGWDLPDPYAPDLIVERRER